MRPYGLGFALNLLALTLIWKFVENPRPRSWFWATLALVLSVQCLYHNAVFLAAFCLAGGAVTLARRQWRTAAQVAGMGAVSALSLLPHLGNIMKGRDWLGVAWHPVGWEELGKMPAIALRASGSWMVWFWPGLALLALGTAFILAIRSRTWRMGFFAIVLLGSTLLYGVFLDRIAIQLRSWYFLILLAPAALSVDIILAAPAVPRMRLGRAGLALLLAAASIPACFAAVQVRQSNADLVAQTLRIRRQAGDLILVSPWYYGVALQRYYTNHFDTLPPMSSEDLRIHRYDLMKKQMMAENPVGPLLEQARQTLRSGQDLWVVGDFQFPPPGRPQPILPPYREGMVFDVPAAHYWSSWLFQFSQMIQDHATSLEQPDPSIAGGAAVSPLENIRVYVFHGWKE
jgi:hypothetical protein